MVWLMVSRQLDHRGCVVRNSAADGAGSPEFAAVLAALVGLRRPRLAAQVLRDRRQRVGDGVGYVYGVAAGRLAH
jgi:hypothetical protein